MLAQITENIHKNERKRSKEEICAEILAIAERGAKKSHIVFKANLNFKFLDKYLVRLKKSDLITGPSKSNLFSTTEKGIKYLEHFRELRDFLPL
jgi:predicted transcriptional regulator